MDTRAARRWAPRVDEHRRSGLTIKAFCEKHNLHACSGIRSEGRSSVVVAMHGIHSPPRPTESSLPADPLAR